MDDNRAEQILDAARDRFDAAEVFEETSETISVSFEDNRLKEIQSRQRRGVGLRVIQEGRIGFASTTDLREAEPLLRMAAASAEFGDEAEFEFPGPPEEMPGPGLYDDEMEEVGAEEMVEIGREGLALSREADEDCLYAAHLNRSLRRQRVLNSSGLDLSYRYSRMSADVEVQKLGESGLLQIYEYRTWGRPFDSVAPLTGTVLGKMRDAATIAPTRPEEMPMIFTPKCIRTLLQPVEVALNGKRVHKGSSVLRGRIGEQVLDERLTLTDDPGMDFAPGSCPADDEGVPARRRELFEDGVLRTYLADLQTAGLLGIEPTGRGFRSYAGRPSPSTTNVLIAPGDTPLEDMLEGMGRGLIIDQTLGSGQSNVLAGEFSINVGLGFLVEDGEVQGRVKDCMVAGNVYEVLGRIEALGTEADWFGSICAPPVMVGGLKLAAQG